MQSEEQKPLKVRAFGSVTIDIVNTLSNDAVERVSMSNAHVSFLMIEEGRKIDAERIDSFMGGGASNVAVSMARQGADVGVVARVGRDLEGEKIRKNLESQNVDCRFLQDVDMEATGRSVIISAHNKNAGIFTARGANTSMRPEDVKDEMFDGVDLVYITGLSGKSAECLSTIVHKAFEAKAKIAINPGILQLKAGWKEMLGLLHMIDLVAINEVEASVLCTHAPIEKWSLAPIEEGVMNTELIANGVASRPFAVAAGGILSLGVNNFLITNGAEGAYLVYGEKKRVLFCPSLPAKVEGTVGAGDSYTSTLSHALLSGESAHDSLRMASINAASVVTMADAQSGLLDKDEIRRRLQETNLEVLTGKLSREEI